MVGCWWGREEPGREGGRNCRVLKTTPGSWQILQQCLTGQQVDNKKTTQEVTGIVLHSSVRTNSNFWNKSNTEYLFVSKN